jgi:hypothetical protein
MAAGNVAVVTETNPLRHCSDGREGNKKDNLLIRLAHTECARGSFRYTSICFVTDRLWFPSNTSPTYVFEMAVLGRRTGVCQTP